MQKTKQKKKHLYLMIIHLHMVIPIGTNVLNIIYFKERFLTRTCIIFKSYII